MMEAFCRPVKMLLAKHEFFKICVGFETQRGQDLNAVAKILIFEYTGELQDTKKIHLDGFVKETKDKPRDRLEVAGRRAVDLLDEMAEIFLPEDRLLSSAGTVPVYYWLVRSVKDENYIYIREFLVNFESARHKNKELITQNPMSNEIDQELTQ